MFPKYDGCLRAVAELTDLGEIKIEKKDTEVTSLHMYNRSAMPFFALIELKM